METSLQKISMSPLRIEQEKRITELRNYPNSTSLYSDTKCCSFEQIFTTDTISMQQIVERKRDGVGAEKDLPAADRNRNADNWRFKFLAYIAEGIKDFLDFKNRRTMMNARQIAQTAEMIYEEYPLLTVSDISLFIRMCKMGKFGDMIDLDGTTLIRWCGMYGKERYAALNDYYRQLEKQERMLSDQGPTDIHAEEIIARLQSQASSLAEHFSTKQPTVQEQIAKIRLRVIRENSAQLLQDLGTYEEKMNELINAALIDAGLKQP